MQAGIDSSRASITSETAGLTQIDIRPDAATSAQGKGFFNAEGPSFRDVLDAINPLNHIPGVSTWLQHATGHTPSTASNLVGGALLGGPIGFVASLASEIFTSATGSSPAESVYAALTGESTTQVAQNTPAAPEQLAELSPAANASLAAPVADVQSASPATVPTGNAKAVLDLYGASSSAHESYKKAQLLPYLRDVNTSKVL